MSVNIVTHIINFYNNLITMIYHLYTLRLNSASWNGLNMSSYRTLVKLYTSALEQVNTLITSDPFLIMLFRGPAITYANTMVTSTRWPDLSQNVGIAKSPKHRTCIQHIIILYIFSSRPRDIWIFFFIYILIEQLYTFI